MTDAADRLIAAGLSPAEAARKAALLGQAVSQLGRRRSEDPSVRPSAWFVPGRIEVLGKHTDYAGGRSLVCAVERGFCLAGRASPDPFLTMTRADTGEQARVPLDPDLVFSEGEWATFPAVVARRLARDFGITRGAELAFASDLPVAAGLSSGTALTVGVFLGLAEANRLAEHPLFRTHLAAPEHLAEYLGCLENGKPFGPFQGGGGVGTLGGCEDQAAILLSQAGTLAQFRFVPVRLEGRVRLPDSCCFAVASSGVTAEKSGGAREAYNAAAAATGEILRRWREATGSREPSLGAVVTNESDGVERVGALLAGMPALLARFEQFVAESEEIVPGAAAALGAGNLEAFGTLVDRSQAGAERGLGNQIPETMTLQRNARRLGAPAASAFGAGFGGSVWALVERSRAGEFLAEWRAGYLGAFPRHHETARFFLTAPAGGSLRIA
jgi:galactokinase